MSEFGRLHRPSRRIVLSLQSRYLCLSTQPPTAPLCNHHPRGRSDPFRSHRTHPIPKTGFGPVRSPALVSSLIVDPFCSLDLVSSLIGFGTATQKLTNPHPDLHHTYAMARHLQPLLGWPWGWSTSRLLILAGILATSDGKKLLIGGLPGDSIHDGGCQISFGT